MRSDNHGDITKYGDVAVTFRSGNSSMRPTRRQKEEMAMALRMLWRSTAALLAEHLGADAQALPSDWNPIASLAGATLAHSLLFAL